MRLKSGLFENRLFAITPDGDFWHLDLRVPQGQTFVWESTPIAANIFGTSGDDTLDGTMGDDEIYGYGGDDTISTNGGSDLIYGGDGNDIVNLTSSTSLGFFGGDGFDMVNVDSSLSISNASSISSMAVTLTGNLLTLDSVEQIQSNPLPGFEINYMFGTDLGDYLDFRESDAGNALFIVNGTGNDQVYGSLTAQNFFYAGAGISTFNGGQEADSFNLRFGEHTSNGQGGDDTFNLSQVEASQTISGWTGFDTINIFQNGTDSGLYLFMFNENHGFITDGFGNDHFFSDIEAVVGGTVFSDVYYGSNGNESFETRGLNDVILTYDGDDKVFVDGIGSYDGGDGVDTIDVSAESTATYNETLDIIEVLNATHGVVIDLQSSRVIHDAFGNAFEITGFENASVRFASAFSNELYGDNSDNILEVYYSDSVDTIMGRGGDDLIQAGSGADTLFGGSGTDTLSYERSPGAVWVDISANVVSGSDAAGDTIGGFENIIGTDLNDVLIGNDSNNEIQDNRGDDKVYGGLGDDVFIAGDTLVSGDEWFGGDGTDTLSFEIFDWGAVEGVKFDLANGIFSFQIYREFFHSIENFTGSHGQETILGSHDSNVVTANGGNDLIVSRGGADHVFGGNGADVVNAGAGDDIVQGDAGADIISGQSGSDDLSGGEENDSINGGGGDDSIKGDNGVDLLAGGTGSDVLFGGSDDDILSGGAQNDQLYGGDGADDLSGNAAADTLYGGEGADILNGQAGVDVLYGDSDNDMLFGGGGSDDLYGGDGNDVLNGGAGVGNDEMWGDAGADVFVLDQGFRIDRIKDFENGIDRIDFSGNALANDFADVAAAAVQFGLTVRIELNANNTVILENFDLADLDASDFVF